VKNNIDASNSQRISTPLHEAQSEGDSSGTLPLGSVAAEKLRVKKPASSLDSAPRVRPGSGSLDAGHAAEKVSAGWFQHTIRKPGINHGFAIDLAHLNRETNIATVSKKGNTSKAVVVIEPAKAKILAVLKLVNKDEIFANKLFAALGMPIPSFQTVDKSACSNTIKNAISETPLGNSEKHKTILVMECVNGKAMSEIAPKDLKDFFLAGRNLELLGMSMALDTLIGNADRIISFIAPVINPDNIMFDLGSKSVVFIDQAYKNRPGQVKLGLDKLAKFFGPQEPGAPDVYTQYILPLAKRSIQKYCIEELDTKDESEAKKFISKFEDVIDKNQKISISKCVMLGISKGFRHFLDNKKFVLGLCAADPAHSSGMINAYSMLSKDPDRFKENTLR
jgi:hypothetical protein